MPEARNWKQRFLAENPLCCFCGGTSPAAEPDHVPGRVFFRDRQWPEGFVFPSCEKCNRVSRTSEDIVSLLTSYFDDDANRKRYCSRRDSVRLNHPEVIESLKMSSNELRAAAKSVGISPHPGQTYASLPIAKIDPNIWLPHFRMVGKKIVLGLHYQCFQRPLGSDGTIWLSFNTNADLNLSHDLDEMLAYAPQLVMPMRNKKMLGDQFAIRYGISVELQASLFVIQIQHKLVITSLCVENPVVVGYFTNEEYVEHPFSWQ